MSTMHELYKPANLMELTLADGGTVVLGSVIESGWKCLGYIYSAQMPDGSFAAFDAREIPQLGAAVEKASRAPKARLEALAMAIHEHFADREKFFAAHVGVGQKMAARPAAALH